MQQIADWLEKLGVGQYAQRFAENEIDISVLPHLSDQDLKDIGVPLGHRRKLSRRLRSLLALPVQLLNLLCKRNRRLKTLPSAARSR